MILPVGSGWVSAVRRRLGSRVVEAQTKARVRVQSPGPMKAMLRAGLGYPVLPASTVQPDLTAGTLSGAVVQDFSLSRLLAVPRGHPLSRASQAVMQAIRAETAAIVKDGDLAWHRLEGEPPQPLWRASFAQIPPDAGIGGQPLSSRPDQQVLVRAVLLAAVVAVRNPHQGHA